MEATQKINSFFRMAMKYYGKEIYAYDYHFNIHLDYLGQLDQYTKDLLITGPFQFEQENNIKWGANNIETL